MRWLELLSALAIGPWAALNWSFTLTRLFPLKILRPVFAELKPFALPLWLLSDGGRLVVHGGWGARIGFVIGGVAYWVIRSDRDDDDRWKRRKEKLAARIAMLDGRLQVVPVRSSS